MALTFFFRDLETLKLVETNVLPTLKKRRYIDIWDAGCAMGHEPYTMAILLREAMGHFQFRNVRIKATDLDGSNLFGDIIHQGVYTDKEVGRIPANILEEYFSLLEGESTRYRIRDDIRSAVKFTQHDLRSLKAPGENFGMVICKNVLLHISLAERISVIKMFYEALQPEGFLVTEQTQKLPAEVAGLFKPVVLNAQIHQKVA